MTYWTQMFGLFTAKSFIGVFGYMDIFMSEMVYRLALVLLGICAAGWAFSFRAPAEEDGDILVQKRFHILGGCFAIVVFLLYLKFNLTYFQAQARYLYPAIAPISIGLATGLMFLIKKRNLMIPAGVATLLFLGNMAINSFVSEQFQMRIDAAKELDAQK